MATFKPTIGLITWARLSSKPRAGQSARPGTPKAAGLAFELEIADILSPLRPIRGQWVAFRDDSGLRHCQIDFLLESPLTLVECKLGHYQYTRLQTTQIYQPVLRGAFGGRTPAAVVAIKSRGNHTLQSFTMARAEALNSPNLYWEW